MDQLEKVMANIKDRDNNIYRLYFEANPISDERRQFGFGGVDRYRDLEGYGNSELIINITKHLEVLQRQAVVQSRSLDEVSELAKGREHLLASIPAIQPVSNEDLKRVASGFGWRTDPFTKARKMHWGIDFTSPRGTPVYASGDGVVLRADNRSSGYGKHIRIDHGYGYMSLYAHLSKYTVHRGEKIRRGEIIGYVGNTGRSQAPHLHYEIWKDGNRINPINFYYGSLSTQEFDEMLRVASQENQSLD
ncbi:peptidase M23 [Elysia marginata]|uniref:Peptidase M23 n=1 Tax=Elysia marginata TaxID=1093978 RepID=A0AAV4FX98_9GAST|nr:peptidase M23 [Elysia marginata]